MSSIRLIGQFWLFGHGFTDYVTSIIDDLTTTDQGGDSTAIIGQIIVMFVMTLIIGMIVVGLIMIRKIFAPRLVVVRVNTAIWQAVVKQIADVSAVILIDVSSPGDSLLWELENLNEQYHQRTLLVGQHDALEKLSALPVEHVDTIDISQRLVKLLDEKNVLAYHSERSRDTKHITKLLRAKLSDLYKR